LPGSVIDDLLRGEYPRIDDQPARTIGDQVLLSRSLRLRVAQSRAALAEVLRDVFAGGVLADGINREAVPGAVHDKRDRSAFDDGDFFWREDVMPRARRLRVRGAEVGAMNRRGKATATRRRAYIMSSFRCALRTVNGTR
jgi:hypothetical protein